MSRYLQRLDDELGKFDRLRRSNIVCPKSATQPESYYPRRPCMELWKPRYLGRSLGNAPNSTVYLGALHPYISKVTRESISLFKLFSPMMVSAKREVNMTSRTIDLQEDPEFGNIGQPMFDEPV